MKRIVSFLLVLAIVFSLMAGMGISSNAGTNGHSQADALAWLNSKIGIQIGNGQCPALAREYYAYLGYSVSGNGKDYENNVPSGWSRTYYSSGFIPQPGDIAVWRATNTELGKIYGHVAIVASATSGGMVCYEQGKKAKKKVRKYNYSYGSVTCFIRPDFSGGGTSGQTPVNLGDNFYAVILNTSLWKPIELYDDGFVRLNYEKGTASNLWRFQRQSDGSYVVSSCKNGKVLEMYCGNTTQGNQVAAVSDDWGGAYQRWYLYKQGNGFIFLNKHFKENNLVLDLYNNESSNGTNIITYGRNNGSNQIWSVYMGNEVQTKAQTLKVDIRDKAYFSWTEAYGESYDSLKVWKDKLFQGDAYYIEWNAKNGMSLSLPKGTYFAFVDTINHYNCLMSNVVSFTINETICNHSYISNITNQPSCTSEGTKIFTCSKCGDSSTQAIAALGHDYSGSVTRAATCTEKGIKTFKCSRCTSSYTQDIAALGHNWVKSVHPACIEYEGSWDGYSETKCNRCSASSKKTISAIDRMILSSERFVYTGSAFTPSVKVVDTDGKALKKGKDYKVTYQSGRKAVGSYWVKFTFMGNYQGEITQWFKIIPKGTSLAKLTAGKKSFTAKWKKLGGITGYQIQYSTNAKFTGAKKVTIKGATAAGKTIKNLKAKQVYYVRVRTYKTVSGTHYMSNWSKTYKVKAK